MKVKKKICHGTGKAKDFDACGVPKYPFRYGLCSACYPVWLYSTPEGLKCVEKASLKAKIEIKTETKKADKAIKDEYTDWREKLQLKVQEIARLIDIGQPCLARGYHANQLHGGHVFSKGSNKTIALNLHNIHRQSAQSNHFQNEDGLFRDGLIKEYGQEYFDFIRALNQTPTIKYSNSEYQVFYKHACKISNELKKNGDTFDLSQRISKRNEVNLLLNIYSKNYCLFGMNLN